VNAETVLGREYLRVSRDKSGRARSTEEQHADNRDAAERHGITLNGEAYSDLSVSASRYSAKVRGNFDRLLADVEHGRFGADVLVIWESSRGSRRVGEWSTLLDRLEDARIKVLVATHGRVYDPSVPRDRRSMLEDAVDSEYESAKISLRTTRAHAANAEAGLPNGRCPYGYARRYQVQPNGRRVLLAQEPEPAEADVVSELFDRLLHGHSLRAIARDFTARGILTRTGKPFPSQYLREIALSPVYVGKVVHVAGATSRTTFRGSVEALPDAIWPGIVESAVFHQVRAKLLSPSRKTSRPGRGVHLLSMLARCDVCGSVMTVRYRRGAREYACRAAQHTSINAGELDEIATSVILAYLAQPHLLTKLREVDEGELADVRAKLAAARAELDAARGSVGTGPGKMSVASFIVIEPGMMADITGLEQRETALTTPSELVGLMTPGKDVARRWKAAPMSARRQVVRFLATPQVLGELRVTRHAPGTRGDQLERLIWAREQMVKKAI
jgi:site-specific DNA recombinase